MSTETLAQAIERAGLDYWDDKTVGENEWTSLQEAERMAAAVLAHFGAGSEEDLTRAIAQGRESQTLLPSVGDVWHWEPMNSICTERLKVVSVEWNGEEWWIGCVTANVLGWHDKVHLNEWDRFIEAAVLIKSSVEKGPEG